MTRPARPLARAAQLAACAAICVPAAARAAGVAAGSYAPRATSAAHATRTGGTRVRTHPVRPRTTTSHRSTATHRPPVRKTSARKTSTRRLTAVSHTRTPPAAEAAVSDPGTIAKVLATPCQNTGVTPEPANIALVRAAVLCLINTERAQNGREPLQADAHLEAAAESHGREMIAANYFAHVSPSGLTPVERVRQTGYIPSSEVGYVIGENLAWGTLTLSTPSAIVAAWIASPEHLANILEAKYRDTGIDVEPEVPAALAEDVQGALYTQEFGVIVH